MTHRHLRYSATVALIVLTGLVGPQPSRAAEPFDYFSNSWSVIGLKDYKDGTRITPDNRLLLSDGRELRIRIGADQRRLSREQTKTLMDGWLPVVLLTAQDGPVRYELTFWSTPLPMVTNWQRPSTGRPKATTTSIGSLSRLRTRAKQLRPPTSMR